MTRRLISSGSSFERDIGYSRAVIDGEWIFVSGTTGFDYAAMTIAEGVVAQAEQCMKNIEAALTEAGADLRDVVRVTYMLPDASEFAACWPVLRRHFGEIRPAATMISVGLADPRMRIEIEVTARRRGIGLMVEYAPLILHTPRLRLRFLEEADAVALFTIFSDPRVMRYWATVPWTTMAQAEESLRQTRSDYEDGNALRLGIELRDGGELVGTCTLFAVHRSNRRAEIGYALASKHWGHGYMHEALQVFLRHAFDALELRRIEADIDPRNAASARTLERLGFQREGLLRERWLVNGEVSDTALFGLLAREFAL